MTGRQAYMTLVGILMCAHSVFAQVARPSAQVEVSRLADTAHLEFRGLKNWRYDLKKAGPKRIELTVPPLDEASVAKLQSFNDPLLEKIKVAKNGPDGDFVVSVELAQSDVESFDYQTDEPSRLIIDFYRKNEADAKAAAPLKSNAAVTETVAKSTVSKKNHTKVSSANSKPSQGRKPAGDEVLDPSANSTTEAPKGAAATGVQLRTGIFDSGDDNYDRFRIKEYEIDENATISARHNIYLPFPMLKMKVSQLDKLMEEQPEYVIHPKDTRENKEARLLLTLFERKRFAVFLKTYDYFTHKYPESEYREILKNLVAHLHLMKWREEGKTHEYDLAHAAYNELVQKFPGSPLLEHNHQILGYMEMERQDALGTLQTFDAFLHNYPKSPEIPQVRKALAEAYMILRRYDEATAQYNAIIKDFPGSEHAHEARYRLGDVDLAKGDYSRAIQQYEAAVKELPGLEKVYPNADFNTAEARFWEKDYKKSLNGFVQFVNHFPSHEYGSYALTRIGELLGVLGADQRRVMGALLESHFRFPNSPGAKVARMHMLTQQMRGMKDKEVKKALQEFEENAEKLDLARIHEFTTIKAADGLSQRGEYTEALDRLMAYYQKNPSSMNLGSVKSRIHRNLSNEIKNLVDKGQFIKALEYYSQYSNTWLKNVDRIDIPFFVGEAYEHAGAYDEALAIYRDALAKRQRIVGSTDERERKVHEHLPTVSSLRLRMAATQAQERNYVDAFQNLKAIGKGEDLTPPEMIERVRLSAEIAEQRNDTVRAREALMELAREWNGDPAMMAPVHLHLAQTFLKLGDGKQAEAYSEKIIQAENGEAKVDPKILSEAFVAKGDAQVAQKKTLAAIETYQKALERFEEKMPLANVRYRTGLLLFERGDLKGASEVWKRLEGTPNDFLWKIGKEKLEDVKWRDDYNKYISRIPAMAPKEKKEVRP